ncbi:GDSL-type esterase/lipase family protein [Planctomycetota bacterium]|nr:GDSL-type esterase/lipase family protein [Planctomycetota bacterium]
MKLPDMKLPDMKLPDMKLPDMTRRSLPALALLALALLVGGHQAIAQTDWVEHYRQRVAEFERENAALDPAQQHVVFVGDSLTEGWKWDRRVTRFLPTVGERVLNRGISADTVGGARGVLSRMDSSVFDTQPSHVFLLVGVNELGPERRGVERAAERFAQVVAQIRERLPNVILCLVTSTPTRGRYADRNVSVESYNDHVRRIAAEHELPLLDLHRLVADEHGLLPEAMTADGLHFNSSGYAIWGREIERIVAEGR